MRIAVLGASGVAGRALLPLLAARGHALRAAFHASGGSAFETQPRVEARHCEILDAASVAALVAGCEAVINLATSIPKPGGRGDWGVNDRVRREGTANLLRACAASGARLVQQSVAMLHCADDRRAQTEDDPLRSDGVLASALDLEGAVARSSLDWRIARGALFHGPGTGREEAWRASLIDPGFRIPGDGSAWQSSIHVDDFASALCAIVEHPGAAQAYIVADDRPVTLASLYAHLAAQTGCAPPLSGGPMRLPSFRVSNAKLRGIGWAPRVASVLQAKH